MKPTTDQSGPTMSAQMQPIMSANSTELSHGINGSPSNGDPFPSQGAGAAQLLHAVRRQWWRVLIAGVVLAVPVAISVWQFMPLYYRATATLSVAVVEPRLVFATVGSQDQQDYGIYKQTQLQYIKEPFVLNAALRDIVDLEIIGQQSDPIEWLQRELRVSSPKETEIIRLSLELEDPEAAANIVNAVTAAYMNEVVFVEHKKRRDDRDKLETVYRGLEDDHRKLLRKLRGLAETPGTADPEALTLKQQITLQVYAELRKQQLQIQFERRKTETELQILRNQPPAKIDPNDLGYTTAIDNDALLMQLRLEAETLAQNSAYNAKYLDAVVHADMFREIEEALKENSETEQARRAELEEYIKQQSQAAQQQHIDAAITRVNVLIQHDKSLTQEVDLQAAEAESIGQSSLDVELMRTEISLHEGVLKRVGDELEAREVELKSPARIRVFQQAEVPLALAESEKTRRLSYTMLGSLLAFLLPGCMLVWLDLSRQRVNSPSEIRQIIPSRMLGTLPMLSLRELSSMGGPQAKGASSVNAMTDAVDKIRTMLLDAAGDAAPRTVLITSALNGEAKTTLSAQLALSCARSGRKTLLVDADVRRPVLHKLFQVPVAPGFANRLQHDISLAECLCKKPVESIASLEFLRAGEFEGITYGSLPQAQIREVLDKLAADYDVVIIDSAPLLPIADTQIVARHVDAIVLSVMRDVSGRQNVQSAHELLSSLGLPVSGIVMTCPQRDNHTYKRI